MRNMFMKNVLKNLAVLTGLALCSAQSLQAAVVAQYTFTGSVFTSSDSEANSTAGGITVTGMTSGMGVYIDSTAGNGNPIPGLNVDNAAVGTTLSTSDYLQFVVTANSGYLLNLSGTGAFTVDRRSPATGSSWALRSSVDGYTANLATSTIGTSWVTSSVNLSSSFDNLSSVTFRIYAWNGPNDQDILFDNFTLNGTVTPVPEVQTMWASLLVIGAAVAGTQFRQIKAKIA